MESPPAAGFAKSVKLPILRLGDRWQEADPNLLSFPLEGVPK